MARLSRVLVVFTGMIFLSSCGKPEVPISNPEPQVTQDPQSAPKSAEIASIPSAPSKAPAPSDISCSGTYGTAPNFMVFFENGTCWLTALAGPDICSFTMDEKRVRLSASGRSTSGKFDEDCSKVHFGGLTWARTGPAQDPSKN